MTASLLSRPIIPILSDASKLMAAAILSHNGRIVAKIGSLFSNGNDELFAGISFTNSETALLCRCRGTGLDLCGDGRGDAYIAIITNYPTAFEFESV